MTASEIQQRIVYLQGQIYVLYRENDRLKKDIKKIEEIEAERASLAGKWRSALSNCFDAVRFKLSNINPNSEFKAYFTNEVRNILSSREANEVSECFDMMKSDTRKKASELEDKIKNNNARVWQYQNEMDELRALQLTGVE